MNKWLKSSVFGIIIVSISASFIYDKIKNIPLGTAIVDIFKLFFHALVRVFTFGIPLWSILCLIILLFVYKVLFAKKPKHFQYTQDVFRGWIWKWKYFFNGSDWKISDLKAYCPICEIDLIDNSNRVTHNKYCPKCRRNFSNDDDKYEYERETEILINHKIERNQY
jgi:hypothetical protein